MVELLPRHWPEYLIEAALLGLFMVSACLSVAVLEHPGSAVRRRIKSGWVRRAIVGVLMGLTAVALIYSPWGARSGAHMNPAFTLAFWTLGKVSGVDAAWYVFFQFLGGALGVLVCRVVFPRAMAHESVAHVVTLPGARGAGVAWMAEFAISAGLMLAVLLMTSRVELAPYTGLVAGGLVAAYITFEAPLSGMSINPARTLGSAVVAGEFRALWIYLTAPTAAMVLAGYLYAVTSGGEHVVCGKLNHRGHERCIFRCDLGGAAGATRGEVGGIQAGSAPEAAPATSGTD